MLNEEPDVKHDRRLNFSQNVGAQIVRKLKVQQNPNTDVWFGLGMTGLIGWSVVVPTLLGTTFGIWLDKQFPGVHSWTLTMLIIGLALGCFTAWHWVSTESAAMQEETEGEND